MADGSANHGALANADSQTVLQRINAGASLRQLAKEIGVSNVGLRAWLLREAGEQYNDAITNALTLRVAEADEELEAANDPVSVTRAREIARFARMDLERRRPGLYGVKQTITHEAGTDLGELLRAQKRAASAQQALQDARVIDVTPAKES
jgi:transposase-like protein